MHILNVAQTYFPYAAEGGRPAKVRAISGKLAEHGHSVTVLTANLGMSEWLRVAQQPEETLMGLESTEHGIVAIYFTDFGALSRPYDKSARDTILPGTSRRV